MKEYVIFDGQHLRAVHFAGNAKKLMVTFDYRVKDKQGFGPVNRSAGFARNGFDQLMIQTQQNDWFINDDTAALHAILPLVAAKYDRVHMLGFSMGGYGAFRFAAALGADHLVTVSPQVSIDPAVVPFDKRYIREATDFDPATGDIVPHAVEHLCGVIIFDPFIANDLCHALMLQQVFPSVTLARLGFGGHPATRVLRDAGRAGIVQKAAMLKDVDHADIVKVHRSVRRQSCGYWSRLEHNCRDRWPKVADYAQLCVTQMRKKGADGL